MNAEDCAIPNCYRMASELLDLPICSHHARKIYTEVKEMLEDMVDNSTPEHLIRSARATGTAKPLQALTERGFVYFMRIGQRIKIGYSTNVRQRAVALRADEVLATTPGTRMDERRMHVRFGAAWLGGEFFRPDPDLLEFAATLGRADLTSR